MTMNAFVASQTVLLRALVDKGIIDVIIGDMMLQPNYMDGANRSRTLRTFKGTLYTPEDPADAGDVSRYEITIKIQRSLGG